MRLEGHGFEPYTAQIPSLASWTDAPRTRHFSGTGRYESEFDLASEWLVPGRPLILDLGQARDVQQVSIKPVGSGTSVDVRVADSILGDPALWTPLAATSSSKDVIDLRSPRPVTGRYVLIWLTRLPPAPDAGPGIYQGGIKSVTVSG